MQHAVRTEALIKVLPYTALSRTVLFLPDIITVFSRRQFLWLCRVVAVHAEGQSRSFI